MATTMRAPLTRERVIAAGLAFVDEHGVDALSMRKLGSSLGVEAMSLYNYVVNKEDLLEGIAALLLELVELPQRTPGEWRREVIELCGAVRAMGLAHPNAFPLVITQTHTSLEGWAPILAGFEILRDAGLSDAAAIDGVATVSSYLVGAILLEISVRVQAGRQYGPAIAPDDVPADQALLREYLASPRPSTFDEQFVSGIELLLDGLERRLA